MEYYIENAFYYLLMVTILAFIFGIGAFIDEIILNKKDI